MLLKDWFMTYGCHKRIPCTAPCSLYSVLLDNGLMKDPFLGMNDRDAAELAGRGCRFETRFTLTQKELAEEWIRLTFYGLDTLCGIFLNGRCLAQTDNMHRTYAFEVKTLLREGENTLRLDFHSPTTYMRRMQDRHKLWNADTTLPGAGHIRKASYMLGWDWAPVLPDMGIFRTVELTPYHTAKLENVLITQRHDAGRVTLSCELEITGRLAGLSCCAEIDCQEITFSGTHCEIEIPAPRLWWPNGYGEQNLYALRFTLWENGTALDSLTKTIGLRTLTVNTEPDQYGEAFCFVVNGLKIFAMGADYVPEDSIYSRISPERTEALLRGCAAANFNCLRVWGGGYYPSDAFYSLCDRFGLILWQDFMFACVNVRMRTAFEETVVQEAIDNVKRLRHHACLGLFCGNNEMEDGVSAWGIGESALVRRDYLRLYEELLPDLCEQHAPQVFYWPSSPSSGGGFDQPQDHGRGDCHFWDVFLYGQPVERYREIHPRFCSEFGFSAFPSMKTIRAFAEEAELNPFSQVMEQHQKVRDGNAKILAYCAAEYLMPSNLPAAVLASQLTQAAAVQCAVEHFRRHRGQCMGATYWQLNDCWPVTSWSSVDYFGRWKALHFAAKRFFAPVLLSLHPARGETVFNVSSESRAPFTGRVVWTVQTADFRLVKRGELPVCLDPVSACDVGRLPLPDSFSSARDQFLSAVLYDAAGSPVSSQALLPCPPKHFAFRKPHFSPAVIREGGRTVLFISCDTFAKGVCIDFAAHDIQLSDNFFDLVSPDPVRIVLDTGLEPDALLQELTITSAYDIR